MVANNGWVIVATLLVALLFHTIPLPLEWRWFRPELVILTLFYWSLALPHRVGIVSAAATGLVVDILNGTAVGALAMGMAVADVFILLNYQRIRQFDGLQQSITLGILVALSLLVEHWLRRAVGLGGAGVAFLWSVPLTLICWLPLREILRRLRRQFEVL